ARMFERDVTAPVQQLVSDMLGISSQCQVLANGVSSYTASQGYAGALTVQAQFSTLLTDMKTSITDCNAISAPMSDDDTIVVIDELGPLSSQLESFLDVLRDKKPIFDSVILVTSLIKSNLDEFCSSFETLRVCLLNSCSSDYIEVMQGYIDAVEDNCNVVVPLYG
ncbi:hypothetical protein K501DRAFT_172895, partial [Backusella circina FSU 941]